MTITAVISLLTAIFKAIPSLKAWWDSLVTLYIELKIKEMRKENRDSIKKAIHEQDQREIEATIGYSQVGELSGVPNSDVVDVLPNVMRNTK